MAKESSRKRLLGEQEVLSDWAVSEKQVVFHNTWLSIKMVGFTWNIWTSECHLRTASVLLQGTPACSLPPVGSQKKINGTDSHCEGNVAASVRMSQGTLLRATRGLGNGSMCVQGLSQLLPGAAVLQHTQG